MNVLLRLLRALLRSGPVRALTDFVVADHLERREAPVAVAVRSAIVNQTPGDYLEFGVHTGRSFVLAAHTCDEALRTLLGYRDLAGIDRSRLPAPMRFFAFDAFDRGFPDPEGPDASELRPLHWQGGGMVTRESDFVATCRDAHLDMDRVRVAAGYFADTATDAFRSEHQLQRAAVVHLDCDLYQSTREALAFCTPLVGVGTVLVFDDYFRFRGSERHGQVLAFEQWQAANPGLGFRELARRDANAVAFICSRDDR